jgi:hypothetical protein
MRYNIRIKAKMIGRTSVEVEVSRGGTPKPGTSTKEAAVHGTWTIFVKMYASSTVGWLQNFPTTKLKSGILMSALCTCFTTGEDKHATNPHFYKSTFTQAFDQSDQETVLAIDLT